MTRFPPVSRKPYQTPAERFAELHKQGLTLPEICTLMDISESRGKRLRQMVRSW